NELVIITVHTLNAFKMTGNRARVRVSPKGLLLLLDFSRPRQLTCQLLIGGLMPDDPSTAEPQAIAQPVHDHPGVPAQPSVGIALCLSGGGYRAMLFHLGTL